MKKELVLEYLKEHLKLLNSVIEIRSDIGMKTFRSEYNAVILAHNYASQLYRWYSSDKDVYASVFVLMDILYYEHRSRDHQILLRDYLEKLKVKLSSL